MANNDVTLLRQSFFEVKVRTEGNRLIVTDPLTVKNQINEIPILSLEGLRDVTVIDRIEGATVVYNSNTELYEIRLLDKLAPLDELTANNITVFTIAANTLIANGSPGLDGQLLSVQGNTLVWVSTSTISANNASFFGGQPPAYYANASNLTTGSVNPTLITAIDGGSY